MSFCSNCNGDNTLMNNNSPAFTPVMRMGFRNNNKSYQKAGICFYDSLKRRILLVRSKAGLWGPPKGSLEGNESYLEAAVRETKEETGISLSVDKITHCKKYFVHACCFFFLDVDSNNDKYKPYVQKYCQKMVKTTGDIIAYKAECNDVDANGWFCLDCILKNPDTLPLNSYTKKIIPQIKF